jgi:hypothetical protein
MSAGQCLSLFLCQVPRDLTEADFPTYKSSPQWKKTKFGLIPFRDKKDMLNMDVFDHIVALPK